MVTIEPSSMPVEYDDNRRELYLYKEDMKTMPRVATFLKTMMMAGTHTIYPSEKEEQEAKKQPKKAKLGMMLGVYLPTIQHILGLLMFIRHAWIVGCSGVLESFFMVFMCCLTTFATAISVSAIATNGMVQGGGSYYMLSRNLGPECGGSIGICFYLANTFATCMYLLGAIELLLLYMAPGLAIFGDIHHDPWNNYRLYGTGFMIVITLIVGFGVKFVSFFAPVSLACVIVSILSIFVGAFISSLKPKDIRVCLLGERLLETPKHWSPGNYSSDPYDWCTKNTTGDIWRRYCTDGNGTESCDDYFNKNDVSLLQAIPGIASGIIAKNAFSSYLGQGEVTKGVPGDRTKGEVVSDITTNFVALCAIYFPSVTGILTGANMSGDLRDPQKSIPVGTIMAQLTCSGIFLILVLLYGSTVDGLVLGDKFGASLGGNLIAALLCWPSPWVVLVGAFASSVGAALQCLTSAPRLLQAIARDDIIPFLRFFKVTTKNGEPIRALILTFAIAEIGILIANIDTVAPIIDVFFLMCYLFVNLICVLQTLLKTPNWRPRFKYYHWTLSIVGVGLNFALCIIAGWYYALAAFAVAAFIYKYIQYKGGEKEWGDGISGLTMSTAQKALLNLEVEPHTKNWRPQLLVLCKVDENLKPLHPRFFSLAAQLKAGRGLTILGTVLEGEYVHRSTDAELVEKTLKETMVQEKVKGFSKVLVAHDVREGLNIMVQTVGLGGMKPNTVMVGWPNDWHVSNDDRSWRVFLETVKSVEAKGLALLCPRGIENFPERKVALKGTIDVWWIVHDGGMLILLAFLLQQHKTWKGCQIRIFTVAHLSDNSIQIKKDLETFLYQIRISAEVHVEEMYDSDISAYTFEKTLDMEKRIQIVKEMRAAGLSLLTESIHHHHHPHHHDSDHDSHHSNSRLSFSVRGGSVASFHHDDHHHHQQHLPEEKTRFVNVTEEDSSDDEDVGLQMSAAPSTSRPAPTAAAAPAAGEGREGGEGDDEEDDEHRLVHFTFSAAEAKAKLLNKNNVNQKELKTSSVTRGKLMRMHTAVELNKSIRSKSSQAQIVIVNFPAPPEKLTAEENYMEYLDVLSEGLDRVLMVRGSGKEVVTIYS